MIQIANNPTKHTRSRTVLFSSEYTRVAEDCCAYLSLAYDTDELTIDELNGHWHVTAPPGLLLRNVEVICDAWSDGWYSCKRRRAE